MIWLRNGFGFGRRFVWSKGLGCSKGDYRVEMVRWLRRWIADLGCGFWENYGNNGGMRRFYEIEARGSCGIK